VSCRIDRCRDDAAAPASVHTEACLSVDLGTSPRRATNPTVGPDPKRDRNDPDGELFWFEVTQLPFMPLCLIARLDRPLLRTAHNLSGSVAFLVAKGSHLYCNP
jgi:hypothetical protein